jgi:hypothetical protein
VPYSVDLALPLPLIDDKQPVERPDERARISARHVVGSRRVECRLLLGLQSPVDLACRCALNGHSGHSLDRDGLVAQDHFNQLPGESLALIKPRASRIHARPKILFTCDDSAFLADSPEFPRGFAGVIAPS